MQKQEEEKAERELKEALERANPEEYKKNLEN